MSRGAQNIQFYSVCEHFHHVSFMSHVICNHCNSYGGPSSQTVETRFTRDWHHYLACSLKYIVVIVDGRGTGFKGRQLRNPVKGDLGFWEAKDQINAAK
jgi:Prolyl oligopeptidase family